MVHNGTLLENANNLKQSKNNFRIKVFSDGVNECNLLCVEFQVHYTKNQFLLDYFDGFTKTFKQCAFSKWCYLIVECVRYD